MQVGIATFASALALLLGLGVAAAAQGSILLQGGAGQAITFTGQGAGTDTIAVTLGACDGSGISTLSGTGVGSGSAAIASSGSFSITSSPSSTILTPFPQGDYDAYNFYNGSPSAPGCYAPSHCGANFVFTGSTRGQTGTLLTGVLGSAQFPTVVGL